MRNSIPIEIRNSSTLELCKQDIKRWKARKYPCRMCKDFINSVGFVNITFRIQCLHLDLTRLASNALRMMFFSSFY